MAFTAVADEQGYHLYKAREDEGFAWRPLATIQPGGASEVAWTGYHCASGTGRHLAVVVAPVTAANRPALRDRGGLAYTVDTTTGAVRPLVAGVALKYHTPGCGVGDRAVFGRNLGSDQAVTQLVSVDLAGATVDRVDTVEGQVTSAVPVADGVAGVMDDRLVRIAPASGARSTPATLARAPGRPYALHPAAGGGLDLLSTDGGATSVIWHAQDGKLSRLGEGPRTRLRLSGGRAGHSTAVEATQLIANPTVRAAPADGLAVEAASLDGHAVVGHKRSTGSDALEPVVVATASGRRLERTRPAPGGRRSVSLPSLAVSSATNQGARVQSLEAAAANTTTPKCSVPRNDTRKQVPQPNRQQVVWAIEQGVRNQLTGAKGRPANYANMGLAAYSPNVDFPRHELRGWTGTPIPPSVVEAIAANESAWKHASRHALPGLAGNPSISDYYGANGDILQIDYDQADCGYGLMQVTRNMAAADTAYTQNGKTKVAVDYAENVAAALQILADTWNQLYDANIRANNADPRYLENWYFAVWGYNSGIQPDARNGNTTGCTPSPSCNDGSGHWGLGWTNNPQNSDYPPSREGFLRASYEDAAHPGNWPYQERIFGWMETPILDYQGTPSYPEPTYASGKVQLAVPAYNLFCAPGNTTGNECSPTHINPNPDLNYCTLASRHCWWHTPVTWVNCATQCAQSGFTLPTSALEPSKTNPHPPTCNSTLPTGDTDLPNGTKIVDNLPEPVYNVVGCGSRNWTSSGTFSYTLGKDAAGTPLSVIDFHQLGAGFGGHVYFTHNRPASDTSHRVTGTWTPPALPTHVYNVLAHVPSTGATTSSAHYKILQADGTTAERVLNQHLHQNRWLGLGYFTLGANAKVTLDNVTDDRTAGKHDVAFDAVAFVPVSGTLVSHTLDAVSIFNRNQDLNTNTPQLFDTPLKTMARLQAWAIHFSRGGNEYNGGDSGYQGGSAYPACSGSTRNASCVATSTRNAFQTWYTDAVNGGSSTTNHTPTMSQPIWMGFANPDPPTTVTASTFASDTSYKHKTKVTVSFLTRSGNVVPGSVNVSTTYRGGNSDLAPFVRALITAMKNDYPAGPGYAAIGAPNLVYDGYDLNTHSGDTTRVDPLASGVLPGRAYEVRSDASTLDASNRCVSTKFVSGSVIGYRPLAAQEAVRASVTSWTNRVRDVVNAGKAPRALQDTAAEINNLFFNGYEGPLNPLTWAGGSLFLHAAPIWQQVNARVCVDGTVSTTLAAGTGLQTIAEQGYMPDLWLYKNGTAINRNGAATTTAAQLGDYARFTNNPFIHSENAYGLCNFASRGLAGNPWFIAAMENPDIRPNAVGYCDGGGVYDPPPMP